MKLTMKTPGFLTDTLFYLRTLTIISVSSIVLQTSSMVKDTSDENTFWQHENLEVVVGELKVKATGKNTTAAAELTEDVATSGNPFFKRDILALHKSKGLTNFEETRQLISQQCINGGDVRWDTSILQFKHPW